MPLIVSRRAITAAALLIASMAAVPGAGLSSEQTAKEGLFGIEWRVTELAGTEPIDGHVPTLTLDDTGRAGGNSGCNIYFATATIEDEGAISFSEIGSTYIACGEDVMDQEKAFFEALELAAAFKLDRGALELLDRDGALLVRLVTTV